MLEMTMRNLLRRMGLSNWASLTWAKRLQGAAWALVLVTVLVAAVLLLSGCTAQQAKQAAEGLTASRAEVDAAVARADAMQAAAEQATEENRVLVQRLLEAGAAARQAGDAAGERAASEQAAAARAAQAKAEADAKAARELKAKAGEVAARLDQALAALEAARGPGGEITPEGVVASGMTAAGSLWPGVGVILAALAPTVLSVGGMIRANIQAREARNAAQSIVKSVDVARGADPAVADGMAKNRKLIRAVLTPEAAKIVDNNRSS
jgi:hypothetical protein